MATVHGKTVGQDRDSIHPTQKVSRKESHVLKFLKDTSTCVAEIWWADIRVQELLRKSGAEYIFTTQLWRHSQEYNDATAKHGLISSSEFHLEFTEEPGKNLHLALAVLIPYSGKRQQIECCDFQILVSTLAKWSQVAVSTDR